MNVALFLSRKLSLRQTDHTTSPGVIIAVTGIAISLIIMMVSIATITGFKHDITVKLLGFNAPVSISAIDYSYTDAPTYPGITLTDSLRIEISRIVPQAKPAVTITVPAIFKTDNAFLGIALKGLSEKEQWDFTAKNLEEGSLPDSDNINEGIIISRIMADALDLQVNDRILTHFLINNKVKTRKYTVTGIYNSNFSDYDRSYAFIDIHPLQQLMRLNHLTGSNIELLGITLDDVPETAETLYSELLSQSINNNSTTIRQVTTVYNNASNFFNWLELLDTNVWVILILMACVSSFTLISSLFIIMLQRVNTIGLLKALGAADRMIRNTFIFMAMKIVAKGLIIGNITGISMLLLQSYLKIIPLDAATYYLNYVPININWSIILILNIAVILVSWLILILPSHFVSRISPAKAINYE